MTTKPTDPEADRLEFENNLKGLIETAMKLAGQLAAEAADWDPADEAGAFLRENILAEYARMINRTSSIAGLANWERVSIPRSIIPRSRKDPGAGFTVAPPVKEMRAMGIDSVGWRCRFYRPIGDNPERRLLVEFIPPADLDQVKMVDSDSPNADI